MGWFSNLLGTEKAVEAAANVAESGMSIIDNAFYTDQEKAENAQLLQKNWLEVQKIIGEQSTPTAISRRYIAWAVISLVWLATLLCMGLVLIGREALVAPIVDILKALQVGWAFTAVIVFYFGTHLIGKAKGSK